MNLESPMPGEMSGSAADGHPDDPGFDIDARECSSSQRNHNHDPDSAIIDMKLEVVVIAVSDVERAKRFYSGLGWRLDADFVKGKEFRVVQFTPPGSSCSIHFGTGITTAAHGEHEKRTGQRDANWAEWYAEYMVREQAGKPLPT